MLEKCFSPDEVFKINDVSYNGPLAVLEEKIHLDMTALVQTLHQFGMKRDPSTKNLSEV